jgi:FKBP-type peptidyl-prolyl cis-trans isomerase
MNRLKVAIASVIALVAGVGLSSCGATTTDNTLVTLHYKGGLTQGEAFDKCIAPGAKEIDDGGDKNYRYPVTQREWVNDTAEYSREGHGNADTESLTFTSKDGQPITAVVRTSLTLNTSCEKVEADGKTYEGGTLQAFHELIGKTRKAYFDEDGDYGSGWIWVLGNYIGRPVNSKLGVIGHTYTAEEIYNDPSIKNQIADELTEQVPDAVNDVMVTDLEFFQGITVSIDKLEVPETLQTLYRERADAKVEAETADINAEAKIQEAEANARIAEAEAKARQAVIEGYGSVEAYLKAQAIEAGMNPFQPSYGAVVGPVAKAE